MNFNHEIEKIRGKIAHLSRMIHNVTGGEKADKQRDNDSIRMPEEDREYDSRYEKLGTLILRLQDGDMEPKHFSHIEKQLLEDADALKYYTEFTLLCCMLRELFSCKAENKLNNPQPV